MQVEKQIQDAMNLYKQHKFEPALKKFLKSLEIKETALANRYVGDILFLNNDSDAIFYYLKAYPDYKRNPDFLNNLGILYLQMNKPNKAAHILQEIKSIDPNYPTIKSLEDRILAIH